MISEKRFDNNFPTGQFLINAHIEPFRIDWNNQGCGIMLHVTEDISSKPLGGKKPPIEGFCTEINLLKKNGYFAAPTI